MAMVAGAYTYTVNAILR